ncbi:class I SAM-dependent DNA methyltransferase [Sulfurospirillum arcachonense]|uniref:class I SAM-dependent DNA methyltransferase n=1 Tax=Sulfurospirillum arcachonense TaxID=57666 RepID=UPI00046A9FB3|nr:class I SAM-dependent methyltransferase [Sulfurospirillum arcachonense]
MTKDYFNEKSEIYEKEFERVDNVNNIANAILQDIAYTKNSSIVDFGSGTGLLTSQIAPYVKKITTIDISETMNKKMKDKIPQLDCEIEMLNINLSHQKINKKFDGIISSMTIHHIEDVQALFSKFYSMLNDEASIAIADLEPEDGSFHTEDTGVYHFGFEKEKFLQYAHNAGFKNLKIKTVSIAVKPYGKYPIFLLTGTK